MACAESWLSHRRVVRQFQNDTNHKTKRGPKPSFLFFSNKTSSFPRFCWQDIVQWSVLNSKWLIALENRDSSNRAHHGSRPIACDLIANSHKIRSIAGSRCQWHQSSQNHGLVSIAVSVPVAGSGRLDRNSARDPDSAANCSARDSVSTGRKCSACILIGKISRDTHRKDSCAIAHVIDFDL
jgi:hypothetical protein